MSDSNAGDKITYLLIGAGLGAVMALLFAPKSGRELRDDIADASRKAYKKGTDAAHGVGDRITDGISTARQAVEKTKGNIASAIEAGKQAYREERGH